MLALTMIEQSMDVDRFRCEPIGRHKRARAWSRAGMRRHQLRSTCISMLLLLLLLLLMMMMMMMMQWLLSRVRTQQEDAVVNDGA